MSLRSSIEHENGELRHAGMDSRHPDSQGCLQRNPCQPGLQQSMPEYGRLAKISDDADHSFNEMPLTLTICPFSSLPRERLCRNCCGERKSWLHRRISRSARLRI